MNLVITDNQRKSSMNIHEFKEYSRLGIGTLIGLSLMAIALSLSSCKTRTVYMPFETKVVDSVIYHDTAFQEKLIPYKDSISTRDTTSFLSNPYAYSYAGLKDGFLYHSLGIYPFATVRINVPYFVEKIRRIETPKPYPVERELSWWEKTKMDIGGYAIVAIVITILIVVVKLVYKLKKGG